MADRTAFVTGGSGFIGGALIRRLTADGWTVRALARSDQAAAKVRDAGAEPARGDLADRDALRAGASGCTTAFHAAAHLGAWGDRAAFERDNVEGTRAVLESARAAGVGRFVHVGTEAALLAGEPLIVADERNPLRPDSPAPYSATKARAEALVLAASRTGSFETVSIRPRFVWGKGDTTLLPMLVEQARAGRFAWIGGGHHLTSTTHVDNTVEGLVLGAERGRPGHAYFVLDGPPRHFRDVVSGLLHSQGVEPPTRSIPEPVARALMEAGETAWAVLPLPGEPPLPRFAFWVASQECTLSDRRAREELGYEPVTSVADGLAAMTQ
ncbi:MAG TPA: NAD-dependent epimerase/dehydratase family protein [Solirubrobacteraceae bacterium]|jgi:nucleoside-diphosphate-sugar epimerase